MIERTLTWIAEVNEKFNIQPKKVLDVGSLDRNGNPRSLFPDSEYTGIDVKEGANVDIVMSVYRLNYEFYRNQFDTILCLHILEHLPSIERALVAIDMVLKSGGYFYVSIPSFGFPHHNYPKDYWRITEDTMRDVIMAGYDVIDLEHAKSKFGKHPIINCLGVKL